MAEKKRSKKKVESISFNPADFPDKFPDYDSLHKTQGIQNFMTETPEPEPIEPLPEPNFPSITKRHPGSVTIRTVANTHNYTLLEHVDAIRGVFQYQVVNEKNGTTHDFENLSQTVIYLYEAGLR